MQNSPSHQTFSKKADAVSASPLTGNNDLLAQGGEASQVLSTDEQLSLTATQAVAALKSGRLSATTYVTTLIARAKAVSDLNAMIVLDEAGALASAKQFDADRAAGKALGALAGLPIVVNPIYMSGRLGSQAPTSLSGSTPSQRRPPILAKTHTTPAAFQVDRLAAPQWLWRLALRQQVWEPTPVAPPENRHLFVASRVFAPR